MTLQTNPNPDEILPLMHPASLVHQSFYEFWPTYLLLFVFVFITVSGAIRNRASSKINTPQPDWLHPVICCWGFQSIYSWLIGSTFGGPLLYFALDMLVALTMLIIIILVVTLTWVIAARLGTKRIASLRSLGICGIVIANALLIVSSLLFFYTPIS